MTRRVSLLAIALILAVLAGVLVVHGQVTTVGVPGTGLPVQVTPASAMNGAGAIVRSITSINGIIATGTVGVPVVVARARSDAVSAAAVASVATYTVPAAADGTFEYGVTVTLTTAGSANFTATVAFTDESNAARTNTVDWCLQGTFPSAVTTAGQYAGTVRQIRAKAGTAITIATTGTFTGSVYNVEGVLKQIS